MFDFPVQEIKHGHFLLDRWSILEGSGFLRNINDFSNAKIFFGDEYRTGRRRQTPCSLERSGIQQFNYCGQILTAARLPGSDSTKLVQNHPISMHFGTISGLQSGLGRGESCGLGIWRRPWTRTHFSKCCVRTSRPQEIEGNVNSYP